MYTNKMNAYGSNTDDNSHVKISYLAIYSDPYHLPIAPRL